MSNSFPSRKFLTVLCGTAAMATAAGCAKDNEIELSGGVGITATRSACPAVAVPLHTGDITLFDPATSRAEAIRAAAAERGMTALGEDLVAGKLPVADALARLHRYPAAVVMTSALDGVPTLANMLARQAR